MSLQNVTEKNPRKFSQVYESRGRSFLELAFETFPTRDYCLLTLPHTVPHSLLLDVFTLVPPRASNTFSHVLYIVHRDSLTADSLQGNGFNVYIYMQVKSSFLLSGMIHTCMHCYIFGFYISSSLFVCLSFHFVFVTCVLKLIQLDRLVAVNYNTCLN